MRHDSWDIKTWQNTDETASKPFAEYVHVYIYIYIYVCTYIYVYIRTTVCGNISKETYEIYVKYLKRFV